MTLLEHKSYHRDVVYLAHRGVYIYGREFRPVQVLKVALIG